MSDDNKIKSSHKIPWSHMGDLYYYTRERRSHDESYYRILAEVRVDTVRMVYDFQHEAWDKEEQVFISRKVER